MRIVPIKEALNMIGETVPSVRGRITDVTKQMAGGEGEKAWRFQKLTVKDETGEIKVKVWDRDAFPVSIKGQMVTLSCKDGEKGLTGIKAKEDVYRDVKSTILNVTATGIIDIGDGAASQSAPTQQPSQPASQPANGHATATQQAPAASPASNGNGHAPACNGHQGTGDVKKALNKMANLYLHCLNAAEYVQAIWETSKGRSGDRVMTAEQQQACVSSLFIQSCREGLDGITPPGQFKAE